MTKFFLSVSLCSVLHFQFIYRKQSQAFFKGRLEVILEFTPNSVDSHVAKGLFTWKEGAPASRATRLEGLKHSPPLHATHLTGTVSGLCELSLARSPSTTNITADQGNFFPSYFSFLYKHGPVLCLRLVYYVDLFRLTVILLGR